jgi:hypothetical protein
MNSFNRHGTIVALFLPHDPLGAGSVSLDPELSTPPGHAYLLQVGAVDGAPGRLQLSARQQHLSPMLRLPFTISGFFFKHLLEKV